VRDAPNRDRKTELRGYRTFVVTGSGVALTFVVQLVLARVLGASEYGLYAYVVTWITLLAMFVALGLDTAALRFMGSYSASNDVPALRSFIVYARQRALKSAAVIGVLTFGLVMSANSIVGVPGLHAYILGSVLLIATVYAQTAAYQLQGLQRGDETQMALVIVRPVLLAGGLLALTYVLPTLVNATSMVCITLAVTTLVGAVLAMRVRMLVGGTAGVRASTELVSQWRSVSRSMWGITVGQQILAHADIIIVGLVLGTTEAGIYVIASRLASLVSFATTSLNIVLAPTISALHTTGELPRLQRVMRRFSLAALLYASPALAALVLAGTWILELFGPEFQRGFSVLLILSFANYVITLNGSVGLLMTMTNNHAKALSIVALSAVTMIALSFPLAIYFGMLGVAIGTAVAICLRSTLMAYWATRLVGVEPTIFWRGAGR
jgi:O-antigen/teichoic acid export membrane protein